MARKSTPQPQLNTRTLGQIIDGYILAAQARQLSEHTLADYQNTFRKLMAALGAERPFVDISPADVQGFLAAQTVSKKTVLNYHTGLSALWTWAYDEGLTHQHVMRSIARPKPEKRVIIPYTEEEIRALLTAVNASAAYNNRGTTTSNTANPLNQARNKALILLMLDTGIRAEELCGLLVKHVDTRNTRIKVFGKGDKERQIPFSAATGKALWKYWSLLGGANPPLDAPAFCVAGGYAMTRGRLLQQLVALGRRAAVRDVDCHRFRHTFAVNFLRNGGDVYTLQAMLGHATMEMCRTYLRLAQTDLDTAHRKASPVANWRLS